MNFEEYFYRIFFCNFHVTQRALHTFESEVGAWVVFEETAGSGDFFFHKIGCKHLGAGAKQACKDQTQTETGGGELHLHSILAAPL